MRRITVLLVMISAVVTSLLVPLSATAADEGAIAWTVETVDGPYGTGRPNFSYAADPGATLADTIRVTNTGTTPLELAVYAADAYTTPTGNIDLNTTDQKSVDAGAWVTTDTKQLSLAPGEQADVHFTIAVPEDAVPGDHSAGIITSFVGGSQDATITVDRRLGTRVTVRVSGELAPSVSVADFATTYIPSWNPFEPGAVVVSYRVTNTGNTLVTGNDSSTAAGPFGLFGAAAEPHGLPEVIPGSVVDFHREIPIAPWGWVTGSVVIAPEAIGIGGRGLELVTHDYGIAAVPWSLLIAFVVLGAIAFVAVWLVRRARGSAQPVQERTTT